MLTDIGKCDECGMRMKIDTGKLEPGEFHCPHCGHRYEVRAKTTKPRKD